MARMRMTSVSISEVLRSLIIEANPDLSTDRVDHLVRKYDKAIWGISPIEVPLGRK